MAALGMLSLLPACSGASGSTRGPNPIVVENSHLGTAAWQIHDHASDGSNHQIEGYASATSVDVGASIHLYIAVNPVQTYSMDIYRIGYYQGLGGRLMSHLGPLPGSRQRPCPLDATTGMLTCDWTPSYSLAIPPSWTSGIYLAKLTNDRGYQSYIVLAVRDDARPADLLYQQSVTTYQAYNDYPDDARNGETHPVTGKSLYEGGSSTARTRLGTTRAVMVSFDRPYAGDHGAGNFLDWEVYFVRWLERSGFDVTYSTDIDTDTSGQRLLAYRGFLSVGHDEYWSRQMYDAVAAARDHGVSLGFFGANAIYWQVRFAADVRGDPNRTLICYKDASLDPVRTSAATVRWRDKPANRPEQQLIGVQFSSEQPAGAAPAPFRPQQTTNWVFGGSGVAAARPRVVGYETDRQFPAVGLPSSVPGTYTLLSDSPYQTAEGITEHQNTVVYQAASGAWVFGAGSIEWSWGLYDDQARARADATIERMTTRVLTRFISRRDQLPAAPTGLVTSPGSSGSINLTWTASASGTLGYRIDRASRPDFAASTTVDVPADTTAYRDPGGPAGVYYYRVRAITAHAMSVSSLIAVAVTASYRSLADAQPGLIAEWRLDDHGPAAVDAAGGMVGRYAGRVALGAPGALARDPDSAATFDGNSAALRLPQLPPVGDFSVVGFADLRAQRRWQGGENNTLYGSDGAVRIMIRPGNATAAYAGVWLDGKEYVLQPDSSNSNLGAWTFWALTRSGATLTLYRDGRPVDQRADLPATAAANVSGWIGGQDGNSYFFDGGIDEVSVYRTALAAPTVANLYQAALSGPAPPP